MTTLHDYLQEQSEPVSVAWVDTDLRRASQGLKDSLGDLILKRAYRDTILALDGGHRIIAITPNSKDRLRGYQVDAVYVADYVSLHEVWEWLAWSTVTKETIRWFSIDGETENPYQ